MHPSLFLVGWVMKRRQLATYVPFHLTPTRRFNMPIFPVGCLPSRIFASAIDLKSNEGRDFAYRGGMKVVWGVTLGGPFGTPAGL